MDRLYSFLCWHHGPANSRSNHQENQEEFHLPARSLQVLPTSNFIVQPWAFDAGMMRVGPIIPEALTPLDVWSCDHVNSESVCFYVSFRNKVIWVGIASQIIIALTLSYGLGSVTALSFTMLR